MSSFTVLVLRLAAVAFAGIGVAFLVAPATMGAFVGVWGVDATADNDMRAVYGGLQIACGVLLWLLSTRPEWIRVGLLAQVVLFSGLAGGRFVSWAVVGLPGALGLVLHGGELVGLTAGIVLLRRRTCSKP